MTINKQTDAKKCSEMLVNLRKQNAKRVNDAQAMLKVQQAVRKQLNRALKAGPQTVPQLAEAVDLPAHEVLWHIAAMKKYAQVVEVGLNEEYEYCLYGLAKEV